MKVLFVWLVTCLIWSAVWLFIKLGLRDLPPLSFAWIRLAVALAVLTPLLAARRTPLPRARRDVTLVAGTGLLLLCLNYALLYWGAQYISSGLTAVLQAVTPAFGLVFAYYLSGESVTLRKVGALALGVAGVAVIFLNQLRLAGWWALLGCAAVVAAAGCVALAYVLVRAYGRHLHPTTLMAGQMLCGLVPLFIVGLIKEGSPLAFRWTFAAVAALLYLALGCSVLAFWLNYWLLRRLDATKVLLMSIVEPLLAVLLGALVLGESLTAHALLGGACVFVSAGLLLTSSHSPTTASEQLLRDPSD